jgi:hypothetical protein
MGGGGVGWISAGFSRRSKQPKFSLDEFNFDSNTSLRATSSSSNINNSRV